MTPRTTSRKEVTDMPKGRPAASRDHARSAVSGRFVKLSYAKRNPRTTVVHKKKS